jgi:hypothetical protein
MRQGRPNYGRSGTLIRRRSGELIVVSIERFRHILHGSTKTSPPQGRPTMVAPEKPTEEEELQDGDASAAKLFMLVLELVSFVSIAAAAPSSLHRSRHCISQ